MKQHGSTFKGRHFFTIPYVVWMAIFVVAPLILVVVYAFTSKSGQLTLEIYPMGFLGRLHPVHTAGTDCYHYKSSRRLSTGMCPGS